MEPASSNVHDNRQANRYEITLEGKTAVLEYRRVGNVIEFPHTETPPELRGKGLAGILTKHALETARSEGMTVVPKCSYVVDYISKHPEFKDLTKQ